MRPAGEEDRRKAAGTTRAPLRMPGRLASVDVAISLLLVSFVLVSLILLVWHVGQHDRELAETINVAGRQRMLAQRMVREALLVAVARTAEEQALHQRLLASMRDEWRDVHTALRDGDPARGIPSATVLDAEAFFRQLHPYRERLDEGVARVLAAPAADAAEGEQRLLSLVRATADAADGFVAGMERTVLHYQRRAEANERRHRLVEGLALLAPLLLALVALLIFRHYAGRLRQSQEQLQHAHRALLQEMEERRLAENDRRRLAIAVEQADESVVITDRDGIVQYVNPAFERHTGYARHEVLGRNQRFLNSGAQDERFYEHLWSTLTEGQVWRGRMVNRRRDGDMLVEEQTISPVRDERGAIVNFIGIKRDVTREEHLEERLRQAERLEAIGALAGGIAHDFNNLLTPILGYSELVTGRLQPESPEREHLERVVASARRARELIAQILLFSRKGEPRRRVFALDAAVREVAELIRAGASPDVQLAVELPPESALVEGDASQLHSLALNLAVNALQAMPAGGRLRLSVVPVVLAGEELNPGEPVSGRFVRLEVEDTGTGIDEAVLPRIFEPFFTTKAPGRGTGLGLSTAYGIVRQHAGHITVHSATGRGTRFCVYLPAAHTEAAEATHEPSLPDRLRGTILLVDDEEVIVELCRTTLQEYGFRVEGFTRPYSALRRFAREPGLFDLAVVDHVMPGLSGERLVGYLCRLRPGLPCIVTSGYLDTRDPAAEPDPAASRCAFLAKPFTPRDLVRTIVELSGEDPNAS